MLITPVGFKQGTCRTDEQKPTAAWDLGLKVSNVHLTKKMIPGKVYIFYVLI